MAPCALVVSLAFLAVPVVGAQEPAGGPALTAPPPGLSLTGRWQLDRKLSDDPGEKARETAKGMQTDRRPPHPPVYPGPPPAPGDRDNRQVPTGPGIDVTIPGMTAPPTDDPFRRGGGSSGPSGSQWTAAADHARDLPETLTIAQRPNLILIQEDDDDSRIRVLIPDGARHQSFDRKSEHLTRWENGALKVETWHDGGLHVEELFELAPDRSLLTVSVKLDDGGDPITLERVFRPAPAPQS